MAVTISIKKCGGVIEGAFAEVKDNDITLFFQAAIDRDGAYTGRGKRLRFAARDVEVSADCPELEIRHRAPRRLFPLRLWTT